MAFVCTALLLAGCWLDGTNKTNNAETENHTETETNTVALAKCHIDDATPIEYGITIPENGTWVILGSSTAAGQGANPLSQSWVGQLTTEWPDVTFHNLAIGGSTTYKALPQSCELPAQRQGNTNHQPSAQHNVEAALNANPALVIISYPSNDQANGFNFAETQHNLRLIRHYFAAEGIPILMLSTQPRDLTEQRRAALADFNTQMAPEWGPCWVDVFEPLDDGTGRLQSQYNQDGIHPNNAGHTVIAQQVINAIKSNACIQW